MMDNQPEVIIFLEPTSVKDWDFISPNRLPDP